MNKQDSTQVTWSQVYQDFKGALSGAADALKTGSEHVYEVLVRQQVVNSISLLVVILIGVVASYITYKFANKEWVKEDLKYAEPGAVFTVLLAVGTSAGTIIFAGIHATEIATGFINPEYGAIQDLMKFIR